MGFQTESFFVTTKSKQKASILMKKSQLNLFDNSCPSDKKIEFVINFLRDFFFAQSLFYCYQDNAGKFHLLISLN